MNGEGFRNDTCVSVQWPWIAYPAVLSVATFVFLILTILQMNRHQVVGTAPELGRQDYETSVVPLLHGLHHDHQDEIEGRPYERIETSKDKTRSARKTHLRFEYTPVGWRLIERSWGRMERKGDE